MCPTALPSFVEILTVGCDGVRRWGLRDMSFFLYSRDGKALINQIQALIKETPVKFIASSAI